MGYISKSIQIGVNEVGKINHQASILFEEP
jgi:hypothetical protein